MNPLFPGPIFSLAFVSQTSANLFSIFAFALKAVLFVAVVLILFSHDSAMRFRDRQPQHTDCFRQGGEKK